MSSAFTPTGLDSQVPDVVPGNPTEAVDKASSDGVSYATAPPPPEAPFPTGASTTPDPNAARDLGFGVRVAGNSRTRLLNPDGSFNVRRAGIRTVRGLAPYHALLSMGWGRFLALVAAFYVVVNALFAIAYYASGPTALTGPAFPRFSPGFSLFLRAYFFSVETFGTIGFGHVSPSGLAANILVTIESFIGLISAALATGLVFARFSRPNAAVIYSRHAVIAPYNGITAFMFRCANERSSQLIEVTVQIIYTWIRHRDGIRVREFARLPLEFEKVAFFPLSWTVVHPITETSPLHGCTPDDLAQNEAEFLVLLSGDDEAFSQGVHSRTSYRAEDIIWNARFRPIFLESPELGTTGMDLTRIHDVEPTGPTVPALRADGAGR